MLEILLSFGTIIIAGAIFRWLRPGGVEPEALRFSINTMVLNFFLPALCVRTLVQTSIGKEALLIPAAAWVTTASSLAIAVAVYRMLAGRLGMEPSGTGALVIAASFGNVTYLGLPVLTELYGPEAAKYALFYDLLATTPCLWLIGASVAARYGEGRRMDMKDSLKTIASLPPLWGIAGGMILNFLHVTPPGFIMKALELLAGLVVPLMIFSVGLALTVPRVSHAMAILPAVVIKLAVVPAISFVAALSLGLTGTALSSCLIEGAMPTMVLSLLIASRFRLDVSLSALMIVVTTLLSFLTLPAAVYLAERFTR